MTYLEALKALAYHPHVWRLEQLCADDYPDVEARDAYRGLVVRMAEGGPIAAPPPPPTPDPTYLAKLPPLGGCCP